LVGSNRRCGSNKIDCFQDLGYYETWQVCPKGKLALENSLQKSYPITSEIREKLKHPFGELVSDTLVTRDSLARFFYGSYITSSIGDRTTERLQDLGFTPTLEIIDQREQRSKRKAPKQIAEQKILVASNEPGVISSDALAKLDEILKIIKEDPDAKIRLVIEGEEDLLVLPVVAQFPENTVVFYGQPNEGLVIVFSEKSRERSREILSALGIPLRAA
jgi:GTP-dependent dephospho-CoA kinase